MRSIFARAFVLVPAAQLLFSNALPLDSPDASEEEGAVVGDCLLQSSHRAKSALEAVVEAFVEDATHAIETDAAQVVEKESAQAETLLTGSSALQEMEGVQGNATRDQAKGDAAAAAGATGGAAEAAERASASTSDEANSTANATAGGTGSAEAEDKSAVEAPEPIKDVAHALLEVEAKDGQKAKDTKEAQAFALHEAELARKNKTFLIGESGLRLQIGSVPERSFFTVVGKDCLHPVKGDQLVVHYTGTLKDGSVFDSSHRRGEPFKFAIGEGRVLKGWDEGLLSMCLGERGSLHVPSALAYGKRGHLPRIPEDADLDFDVELLAINDVSATQYHRPKIHWNLGGGAVRTSGSLLCAALSAMVAMFRA